MSDQNNKSITTPEAISTLMANIPLNIKIKSILRQNDPTNWVDGEYKGDLNQLENTVKALEWMINEHIKSVTANTNPTQ